MGRLVGRFVGKFVLRCGRAASRPARVQPRAAHHGAACIRAGVVQVPRRHARAVGTSNELDASVRDQLEAESARLREALTAASTEAAQLTTLQQQLEQLRSELGASEAAHQASKVSFEREASLLDARHSLEVARLAEERAQVRTAMTRANAEGEQGDNPFSCLLP